MNVRFEYLYRDYGNSKNWDDIVFSNPRNIDIACVAAMAAKVSMDEIYFLANKAGVPDLHFTEYAYDSGLDHCWHEVHTFQSTDDPPNDPQGRDIEKFIEALRCASTI